MAQYDWLGAANPAEQAIPLLHKSLFILK